MSKSKEAFLHQDIYPRMRHFMSLGRKAHSLLMKGKTVFNQRQVDSSVIPNNYTVCNTTTVDSDLCLNLTEGHYPEDIKGSMYICQCLGVPDAFMVGDTNIIRMDFNQDSVEMKNRLMWTPAAIARHALSKSRHRFDYFGLMFLSPGLGMFSYTEGMYLLPDGRLSVTSDVDRPWIIDRETLRPITPLGRRDEWLPMMADQAGEFMGNLFAGYSNSHVMYPDRVTNETFLVSYQYKQADGSHPVKLMRWDGFNDLDSFDVVDEKGDSIEIKQSIHELVFTKDYILLADTAFVAGTEMLTPWKNAPLPNVKTLVYIVDRRHMIKGQKLKAKCVEIDEACIHLIAEYDNPEDLITVYMLHTPATNTAEILKSYDKNLQGQLFSEHTVGYGTLPVLDMSSLGKHIIDMKKVSVKDSQYIREYPYCFGPYLYTYMGRQVKAFNKQDLFVMFKGFSKDMLPKRIYKAYKDVESRVLPIEDMVGGEGMDCNNSICKIKTDSFTIEDAYIMPDKVLLYTISCIENDHHGYVLAGIVSDDKRNESSGHEYWLFDASDLSKGPICKLSHPDLNNSTIFHTLYLESKDIEDLDKIKPTYHVPLREDYPEEELKQWKPKVLETFRKTIWPYFEGDTHVNQELKAYARKRVDQHFGKEHMIGEEYIENAEVFAGAMFKEANRMFESTGWQEDYHKNGLCVESKPVSGSFESSGIFVTRSRGIVYGNAKEIFEMLTSPEGYAVIDPISKPEDHKEPIEIYPSEEHMRLEAAIATTNIPMMSPGEFVVLNAIDSKSLIFASKSILHEKAPGGSPYSNQSHKNVKERAINTFVIKVEALSNKHSLLSCINYADMCGKSSGSMNNIVNRKFFLPPLYKRINKKMHDK